MSLRRSFLWMSAAQGSALLLQFAAAIVLARHLTAEELGVYVVAAGIVGTLGVIQTFGLQSFIVREPVLTKGLVSTAFVINAMISILLSTAIFVSSFVEARLLHNSGVRQALQVLSLAPIFSIFEYLPSSHIERSGGFRAMAAISLLSSFVGTIFTITLVVSGYKYMSMAYALLAALVSSCVSYNIIGRKYASLSMSLSEWRRIAHFGSQMFAVTGVISIRSKLSEVLMGNIIGLGALGIYNRATSLDSLIWTNIHAVASKVVFVDFATLHRSGLPLRDRYLQLVEIITAMLWPAFIGFAILAKPFILAVYGSRWLPAAAPLVIIAAGSVVAVSLTMTWEVFVSSGELRTQTRIEATRTVIWLLVFCVACTISLEAAAATRLLDAAIAFFLYRPHLNRLTQTRTVELLPIFARSAALTVIAVAPAAIFMMVWHNSEHAPIFGALGCVGLGVLLWAASLQALHHPLAVQARRMLEGWAGRLRVLSSGQP